jgi:hypothetical protein
LKPLSFSRRVEPAGDYANHPADERPFVGDSISFTAKLTFGLGLCQCR